MTDVFRSRVNTNVVPMPQRDPRAFESGFGEGLQRLGGAMARAQEQDWQTKEQVKASNYRLAEAQRQRDEDQEASRGTVERVKLSAQLKADLQALRETAGLTPETRRSRADALLNSYRDKAYALFPSERVLQRFADDIEVDVQSEKARFDAIERVDRSKLEGEAGAALQGEGAAAIYAAPTQAVFDRETLKFNNFVDQLHRTDEEKALIKRKALSERAQTFADALVEGGNLDAAEALAKSEGFTALVGGDERRRALARVAAGRNAAAAAADATVKAQRESVKQVMDAARATIDGGGIVPTPQARQVAEQARAAGVDEADIIRFEDAVLSQEMNRRFGPAADPDGSKTRAAIATFNETAAKRPLTSDESRQYKRLMALSGTRRQSDAAALKPMAGKSAHGDVGVLAELDKRPQADRFDTAQEVRPGLGYLTLLKAPGVRAAALEGQYELAKDPDRIKTKGPKGGMVDFFDDAFKAYIGPLAEMLGAEHVAGYAQVAKGLYYHHLKNIGRTGYDASALARAVNQAMGATRGGDGQWRGGMGLVGDRRVMLPDWATAANIDRALARHDFAGAQYRDGGKVDPQDIRRNYTPVLEPGSGEGDGDGVYVFYGPGNRLLRDPKARDGVYRWTARQFTRPQSWGR